MNWFETLNEALESEGIAHMWESMVMGGISYGETRRWTYQDGSRHGHLVSITRELDGKYERPVHYKR